jgi:outer membrane protein assembly factor BamB
MKRVLIALAALVLLAAGAAAAWVWKSRHPSDIRGSASSEFVTTRAPGVSTRPEVEVREEPWPTYGFDEARTHFAPEFHLQPPFNKLWRFRGLSLIEFPPAVAYGRLYLGTNDGRIVAVDDKTGKVAWEHTYNRCTAASPAVGDGIVYMPLMVPKPCKKPDRSAPGYMLAFDADTGAVLWRFRAGAIESSPLLHNGLLYFGSWDNKVYALDVKTHRPRWVFKTGNEVKGAPAYAGGTIFIASYDGHVYALNARTGKLKWRGSAQSRLGGLGTFYSTPAVAYGRVFIGNTDGKVYAFGAGSGHVLWVKGTKGYVYSSPAVWNRTVYIGSGDGHLYALDAATGDVRWRFATGGGIYGSPTVIDGVVYIAAGSRNRTWGLDARSGRRIWTFPDGKYTPVVADEERIYLVGYTRVYALQPKGQAP